MSLSVNTSNLGLFPSLKFDSSSFYVQSFSISNVIVKIAKIVQNARPILAKACYIIVECCLSSGESIYSLFQALRKWERRERKRHTKSWRVCAFSVQRTGFSRSLEQASRLVETTSGDSTFRRNEHNSRELEGEGPHGLNVCPS